MSDAVRAFVGNFKGPKGEQGPQGIQGPAGPQGIQGPAGPSNADGIDTVDTSGVLMSAGESTDLQRLIDAIADKVMTKLLAKTDIVQVESTATNKVPSSAYLKSVKDDINSNLENLNLDWKLIGTVTGQSPITLPEQFEQLLIKMEHNNVIYSVYALKNWLSSTAKTFRTGYGMSDGNYSAYIGINVSLTQATLEAYKVGNVVNTNSTSVTAYYR